jgi:hypothetical protein
MGRLVIAVAATLAIAAPAFAQGCGPTRLKVTESITLDMPPAKAWAIVGHFQDMSWDKATVATSGSGGDVPETAVRTVRLKDGTAFGESLYKYDGEAMSYSYPVDKIDVARLPVQNVSATIEVVPDGDAKSKVLWRAAFYRYLKPDEGAPDAADNRAKQSVVDYLKAGLAGLKADARS